MTAAWRPARSEVGHDPLLGTGLDDREHPLLALAQHDLVRQPSPSARRGTASTSIAMPPPPRAAASTVALVRPVAPRSWRPTSAGSAPQLQARLDEQLLEERVADLDDAAMRLARVVERRERRAVHAVAPGVGAEQDDRVADAARAPTAARSSWRMIPTHIALTSGLPS